MKQIGKLGMGIVLGVISVISMAAVYEQFDLNEWSIKGVKVTATASEINAVAHDCSVASMAATTLDATAANVGTLASSTAVIGTVTVNTKLDVLGQLVYMGAIITSSTSASTGYVYADSADSYILKLKQ